MKNSKWGTEFTILVNDAIEKCNAYLKSPFNLDNGLALQRELKAKFCDHIVDFDTQLHSSEYFTDFITREDTRVYTQMYMSANIEILMNKLIAFKANDYANTKDFPNSGNSINLQANLSANQTQIVNITFEDVKKQIEDMSGLSDEETKETLTKIDEIKAIAELQEPKKTKWQKVKPILNWLADKSVDVGIALLPLLLKIGG